MDSNSGEGLDQIPELYEHGFIERRISQASLFREHALAGVYDLSPKVSIEDIATRDPLISWGLDLKHVDERISQQLAEPEAYDDEERFPIAEDVMLALRRINKAGETAPDKKSWKEERVLRIRVLAAVATADLDVNTLKAGIAA